MEEEDVAFLEMVVRNHPGMVLWMGPSLRLVQGIEGVRQGCPRANFDQYGLDGVDLCNYELSDFALMKRLRPKEV